MAREYQPARRDDDSTSEDYGDTTTTDVEDPQQRPRLGHIMTAALLCCAAIAAVVLVKNVSFPLEMEKDVGRPAEAPILESPAEARKATAGPSLRSGYSPAPAPVPVEETEPPSAEAAQPAAEESPVAEEGAAEKCETAVPGEKCYEVVMWARVQGIHTNPEWYPGLTEESSFEDFQEVIATKHTDQKCGRPCKMEYKISPGIYFRSEPKPLIKGVTYSPSPEMEHGLILADDDFTTEQAEPMWASWGRGDLKTIKGLGANAVRLYDNDPRVDKRRFLDEALTQGLDVILGISDFPYLQMPGKCEDLNFICSDIIGNGFTNGLKRGITVEVDGKKAYHPALKAVVLMNEPELKITKGADRCRAVVSALDGVLKAEKDAGITGNLIAFTAAFSSPMATASGSLAVDQMDELFDCVTNSVGVAGYAADSDVVKAFSERWFNSYNSVLGLDEQRAVLQNYAKSKPWTELKIPIFASEYHSPGDGNTTTDLQGLLALAKGSEFPFFLGYSFFEFQVRYDRMNDRESSFGMYGLETRCKMTDIIFFGKHFPIFALMPWRVDGNVELEVAKAFGGKVRGDHGCQGLPAIPEDALPKDLERPWIAPENAEVDDDRLKELNETQSDMPGDVVTKKTQKKQKKRVKWQKARDRYKRRDHNEIAHRLGGNFLRAARRLTMTGLSS